MKRIKRGDNVIVLLGKDEGKSGVVLRVLTKENRVLVEGVNKVKRHIGKKVTGSEGTILEIPKPIDISNVALICPNCKKPTRVSFKIAGKEKVRVCKKCRKEITEKEIRK